MAGGGRLQVRILGCGSSGGVPRIGNDWGVCDPAEPRNRRSREVKILLSAKLKLIALPTATISAARKPSPSARLAPRIVR